MVGLPPSASKMWAAEMVSEAEPLRQGDDLQRLNALVPSNPNRIAFRKKIYASI